MHHKLFGFHALAIKWRYLWSEELLALFVALVLFATPATAAIRMQERSLYMNSSEPGATTFYDVAFRYMTPAPVGSVDMQFCIDPIPYIPCVTPPGMDVSQATLTGQSGEAGYSISTQTTNHIVLTRTPDIPVSSGPSSYRFEGIVNPTDTTQSLSIRLRTHSTTDATGPQIDFGSVKGQVINGIEIQTQVPPMLIFCVAGTVQYDCTGTNDNYYTDMGQLDSKLTLTAQSQMAVGTNATGGFVITANGTAPAAGTNVIDSPDVPTENKPGTNQFGINLVANDAPTVGNDPEGTWANAVTSPDYSIPNRYKYVSGDMVAYSPNVSLMKRFTVSYVLNSSPDLRAGVYTTTINYIASGRF